MSRGVGVSNQKTLHGGVLIFSGTTHYEVDLIMKTGQYVVQWR